MSKPVDEEKLSDLADISTPMNELESAISTASTCETQEDFDANVADAIGWAEDVLKELKALKKVGGAK